MIKSLRNLIRFLAFVVVPAYGMFLIVLTHFGLILPSSVLASLFLWVQSEIVHRAALYTQLTKYMPVTKSKRGLYVIHKSTMDQ